MNYDPSHIGFAIFSLLLSEKFCLKTIYVECNSPNYIPLLIPAMRSPQRNYPYPHWAIWFCVRLFHSSILSLVRCKIYYRTILHWSDVFVKGVCLRLATVYESEASYMWCYVIFNFLIQLLTNRFLPINWHTNRIALKGKGVWWCLLSAKKRGCFKSKQQQENCYIFVKFQRKSEKYWSEYANLSKEKVKIDTNILSNGSNVFFESEMRFLRS